VATTLWKRAVTAHAPSTLSMGCVKVCGARPRPNHFFRAWKRLRPSPLDGYGRGRTRALMRIMTDALDLARPERPAFPAPIPDWVPASIAQHVRKSFWPQSPALVRLVTDPRMRSVWIHLTRKHRLTDQYLQPARWSLRGLGEASLRQDFALEILFNLVLELAECRPRTVAPTRARYQASGA
jgi:hypothetical protein